MISVLISSDLGLMNAHNKKLEASGGKFFFIDSKFLTMIDQTLIEKNSLMVNSVDLLKYRKIYFNLIVLK